jgi:hypothetical protein
MKIKVSEDKSERILVRAADEEYFEAAQSDGDAYGYLERYKKAVVLHSNEKKL